MRAVRFLRQTALVMYTHPPWKRFWGACLVFLEGHTEEV